jgi:hypothetical protein
MKVATFILWTGSSKASKTFGNFMVAATAKIRLENGDVLNGTSSARSLFCV